MTDLGLPPKVGTGNVDGCCILTKGAPLGNERLGSAPRGTGGDPGGRAPGAGPVSVFRLAGSPLARGTIMLSMWLVLGVFDAERTYIVLWLTRHDASLPRALSQSLSSVTVWAAFTPLLVRAARRWRLERHAWLRPVRVHLALALGFALLDVMIDRALAPLLEAAPGYGVATRFFYELLVNTGSYTAVVAVVHAADYAVAYGEHRAAAAMLAAELAQARFLALRAQLQPHFLFNTLNSVAELVHVDSDRADRMVTQLGFLLRRSIDAAPDVSLRSELEMLEAYLDIMRARLGDRVITSIRVEPGALNARLPALLLQPVLENAFRHGVEPKAQPGRIEISARRVNELLELVVRDNGRGFPMGRAAEGVGLQSVRTRLECFYPGRSDLTTENAPDGGAVVRIRLPIEDAEAPAVP